MLKSLTIPVLIAISFSFVNPCSQPGNHSKNAAPDDTIYDVKVIYPEFESVAKTHAVDGTFDASEINIITANANGKIEQVFVDVGDTVSQDDPVSSITSQLITERIDIKRSRIKELQARLLDSQGRIELAAGEDIPATVEDTVFLDEEPLDQPAQKQFGDANAERPRTVKAVAEILEATLERLGKEADALDRQLLDLTQNSPVNGIVTKRFVTEGNIVSQKDQLLEISRTDPMSVSFYLPDSVASFVDKHSKVKVSPKDAPEVIGTGTVYFINPNVDTTTSQIEVRAHVSNSNNQIKGGQKATVRVSTRKMDRVIILPKRVLHFENDKTYCFIAYRDQAKLVAVEVGDEDDKGQVQIFGDLRVDDPIIIDRPVELRHNSFIRIQKKEES